MTLVFSYGSNSVAQLRARVSNSSLTARPARLRGHTRIFAMCPPSWGGGVASLQLDPDGTTLGAVVELTEGELAALDVFESSYERRPITVEVRDGGAFRASPGVAYFCTSPEAWAGRPTEAYLTAIHANLREQFGTGAATIEICRLLRDGRIERVDTWTYPGCAALGLDALVVEANLRRSTPWVLPQTMHEIVGKLRAVDVRSGAAFAARLADPDALNRALERGGRSTFSPETLRIFGALLGVRCHPPHVLAAAEEVEPAVAGGAAWHTVAPSVTAIFTYGTLRADYNDDGDRWKVVDKSCCWQHASVDGFSLHQEKHLFYPFATKKEGGCVYGTLLTWNVGRFPPILRRCDEIEGFDGAARERGLYQRKIVPVSKADGSGETRAYMYYQTPAHEVVVNSRNFEDGDWLSHRRQGRSDRQDSQ